jgi:H+-transporting ATPase
MKGFPQTIRDIIAGENVAFEADVSKLAEQGRRVLAVAAGPAGKLKIAGLVALEDPPREDSRALVQALNDLGVRVAMVTGDGLATAVSVARQVGIGGKACSRESLRQGLSPAVLGSDVFAGVLPEDKFHLVKALQHAGHTVGMTGDGVNDAPALKQAEVGIAVANAADVAKAAASLVLTSPGLAEMVAAIETSRRIYQRMLTYTLNKIIKTCELALFLSLGLIFTGTFVTTPLLVLLLFFTNDFVTMSIATDRVNFGRAPEQWQIRPMMRAALIMAAFMLLLSFAIFFWGRDWLQLPLPQLQTLVFTMLVFSGQGTVYLVRERRHFWNSRPSAWLLCSSLADVVVVALVATQGVLMAPVPLALVAETFGVTLCFLVLLDFLKVRLFQLDGTAAASGASMKT